MVLEAGASVGTVVGSGMEVGSGMAVGAAVGVDGAAQAARISANVMITNTNLDFISVTPKSCLLFVKFLSRTYLYCTGIVKIVNRNPGFLRNSNASSPSKNRSLLGAVRSIMFSPG